MPAGNGRPRSARLIAAGLWFVLVASFLAWGAFLWHPWIDWFGRPR
ncbi:MAG: hypothetical protein IAI50_16880 [Candidatus Eremiobacteraeota bacterium]|nr:hypothetical protein [Candidatus Eremiobacteraeota bacterium]